MRKKDVKKYCSAAGYYYFGTTRYVKYWKNKLTGNKELTGSYIVFTEIEKLCKKGIRRILIDELKNIVTSTYPEKDERKLEGRVDKVIEFSINPPKDKSPRPLLEKHDDSIVIL